MHFVHKRQVLLGPFTCILVLFLYFHTNTDVSELASFVEVCSGSAGEEEYNMKRLSCLHSVGTNFAALIYGLPDNANFDKFDERCKTVENLLEHNPKLGESLVSTQGIIDSLTTRREEVL